MKEIVDINRERIKFPVDIYREKNEKKLCIGISRERMKKKLCVDISREKNF